MDQYTIDEIEEFGIEDGTFDRDNHMPYSSSYGSSVDITDLTDEQLEIYKMGYDTGAEDYDLYGDDDEDEEDDW